MDGACVHVVHTAMGMAYRYIACQKNLYALIQSSFRAKFIKHPYRPTLRAGSPHPLGFMRTGPQARAGSRGGIEDDIDQIESRLPPFPLICCLHLLGEHGRPSVDRAHLRDPSRCDG